MLLTSGPFAPAAWNRHPALLRNVGCTHEAPAGTSRLSLRLLKVRYRAMVIAAVCNWPPVWNSMNSRQSPDFESFAGTSISGPR